MKEWADRPYLHDPPVKPNSSGNHSVSSSCAFHSSHSLSDTNVSTTISISTQQPNGICDTPKALRAWAREHDLAGGQLTILAIEPAAGGRQPGGTSGSKTAALREFAFSTIPLKTIPPGPAPHREPTS